MQYVNDMARQYMVSEKKLTPRTLHDKLPTFRPDQNKNNAVVGTCIVENKIFFFFFFILVRFLPRCMHCIIIHRLNNFILVTSEFTQLCLLKFFCKSGHFLRRCRRKQKWVLFIETPRIQQTTDVCECRVIELCVAEMK